MSHDGNDVMGAGARRPGRPRDPEADEAILRAAQETLTERGLQRFTVDDVARRAGVGKATLYRRWPSRAALVVATIERLVDRRPVTVTGDPRADLASYLRTLAERMRDPANRRLHADILFTLAHDDDFARRYTAMVAARQRAVRELVAAAAGHPADGDAGEAARLAALADMILGPLVLRQFHAPDALAGPALDALVDQAIEVIDRGAAA